MSYWSELQCLNSYTSAWARVRCMWNIWKINRLQLTWGQWPADLALLSISWIVFFLESGSFLDTSTGWRQRTSPVWSGHTTRNKHIQREKKTQAVQRWSSTVRIAFVQPSDKKRKASHGQRWAWPSSPHARQWRATPRRCTQSRQRRWNGGPPPGSGPHCCWPGFPSPPRGNPCRKSRPSLRRPSLSDTWTCKVGEKIIIEEKKKLFQLWF